jgi:cytidylate kinase
LNPVKIFVSGPPASGKSHFAAKLGHYYNIPHIQVGEILKRAFNMAAVEETEDEFALEIKGKIDEIKDQMYEKYTEAKEAEKEAREARGENVDDEEEEEEDPDKVKEGFKVRLPNVFLYQILR